MIGDIKIAAACATLCYGGALVYDLPIRKLETAVSGKYRDRIPSSDDAPISTTRHFHRPTAVLEGTGDTGKSGRLAVHHEQTVRLITIGSREGENTSVRVRRPQIIMAQRWGAAGPMLPIGHLLCPRRSDVS